VNRNIASSKLAETLANIYNSRVPSLVRVRAKDDESFFLTAFLIAAMFYFRGYSNNCCT